MNLLQAYKFLDMITEGKDSYLDEYKNYIVAHKERVTQFAEWLLENLPELFEDVDPDDFLDLIEEHDGSKFSEEEFEPYAQYFYGTKDNDFEFNKAWEHHYTNNEHHPEYWNGDDMPYIYILEMLCDWGSFSIENKNFKELSDYYFNEARDDSEKNLSEATKEIIEDIISKIDFISSKEGGK